MAVVLLALGLISLGLVMARGESAASATPVVESAVEMVTVSAGDTLWGIATDVAPEADPRATIAHIAELNALDGEMVQAGQQLKVPASATD